MIRDNASTTLFLLLRALKIPVTKTSILKELELHPDYPSIMSLSDVLLNWKIPNAAFEIATEDLNQLPCPFIAYISDNEGSFVLVTKLDHESVTVSDENIKSKKIDYGDFINKYKGIVLLAETDNKSGEPQYVQKRRKEMLARLRMPLLISASFIILLSSLFLNVSNPVFLSLPLAFLTLFKSIGLLVSVLLLIQSIDTQNSFIQRICSGTKTDCNAILSSSAAKITDDLSWAEVGFFYFSGSLLILLFNSNSLFLMQMLALLNLLSLPYTFYSIYFQAKVAKQWCVLCCSVQAVLWLEFIAFLPIIAQPFSQPSLLESIKIMTFMAAPILLWMFIKPLIVRSQMVLPLKQHLRDFKYNSTQFQTMLNQGAHYRLPDTDICLTLGNPEAENIITVVSNPFCPPCAIAHKVLDDWIENRPGLQLRIVFTDSFKEDHPNIEVNRHFMALRANNDDVTLKNALNDWYAKKYANYEIWAQVYPAKSESTYSGTLKKQMEWCSIAEITGTPTFLINGRKLPKLYQITDIKYLI